MIRNLCKDNSFLSLKAIDATLLDKQVGIDLKDTLIFHKSTCVGMAANMIGVNKKIIAFFNDNHVVIMYNPIVLRKYGNTYQVEEGCLCHNGKKLTTRYEKIQVSYLNEEFKKITKSYSGFTSEIIQHELDHLEGVLI